MMTPIVWRYMLNGVPVIWDDPEPPPEKTYDEGSLVPLYWSNTTPLSEDEIIRVYESLDPDDDEPVLVAFTRAIERAHGIGVFK